MALNFLSTACGWLVSPAWAQAPTGWAAKAGDPAKLKDLEFVFAQILSVALAGGGLVAFVYLLIGGFKYMTASGDEKQIMSAQNTITYAFVGLLVVVLSWLILNTLGQILDLDLLEFAISPY